MPRKVDRGEWAKRPGAFGNVDPYRIYWWALSAALAGYLAFVPFGPYPVHVLGTKLDIIFAALLLALLLPAVGFAVRYHDTLLSILLGLYLLSTFLSVPTSDYPLLSLREWLVSCGYATIAYVGSAVFHPFADRIRVLLLGSATLVAFAALILFIANYSEIRFAFGPAYGVPISDGLRYVDPNFTAVGLMICALASLPLLRFQGSVGVLWVSCVVPALILIVATVLITLSRTALVSGVGGIVVATVVLGWKGLLGYAPKGALWKSGAIWWCGGLALVTLCFVLLRYELVIIDRLANSLNDRSRISIIKQSLDTYTSSMKDLFFGAGFMVLNPHNEYLRNFTSSGPAALICFVLFTMKMGFDIVAKEYESYLSDLSVTSLFSFIFTAIMFYPLVKPFWASIFILMLFYNSRVRN